MVITVNEWSWDLRSQLRLCSLLFQVVISARVLLIPKNFSRIHRKCVQFNVPTLFNVMYLQHYCILCKLQIGIDSAGFSSNDFRTFILAELLPVAASSILVRRGMCCTMCCTMCIMGTVQVGVLGS